MGKHPIQDDNVSQKRKARIIFHYFSLLLFLIQFKFYSSIDTFDITMRFFYVQKILNCKYTYFSLHNNTTTTQIHNSYLYCMKIILFYFEKNNKMLSTGDPKKVHVSISFLFKIKPFYFHEKR